MSEQNSRIRKLVLNRETVRSLSASDVRGVEADPDRQFCTDARCSLPCVVETCEEGACFR
ncbi:MAG TPA: hypothetical protein VGV85_09495 [Longimicrobiaceae bacterium]|nr:hypothetical protein [Longimicrobiaceae bacterium]